MEPRQPTNIHPLALAAIRRIEELEWAPKMALGGGLALAHYLEYRETNDVDCWWEENTTSGEKERILREIRKILEEEAGRLYENATVAIRSWGETHSIEVKDGARKVFSWQVADRTRKLQAYLQSPYGKLKIETLRDNLASKMCALVGRGSPRDFTDIYTAIHNGLITWDDCWVLWETKNPGKNRTDAEKSIALSLAGIEGRRPLNSLPEDRRDKARRLREFFECLLPKPE
jgi:predicted nucleotidyltransferase component of viral defense system